MVNVGMLEHDDRSFTETDHEAANCNVLNTYFTSVLTNKSLSNINEKKV